MKLVALACRAVLVAGLLLAPGAPSLSAQPLPDFKDGGYLQLQGEVQEVVVLNVTGDRYQDLLFQQGHRIQLLRLRDGKRFSLKPPYQMWVDLPKEAYLWDVEEVTGGAWKDIVFMGEKGVSAIDLQAAVNGAGEPPVVELLLCRNLFRGKPSVPPVRRPFLRDLNSDGKADLIVPQRGGYELYVRDEEGGFSYMQRLRLQADSEIRLWSLLDRQLRVKYSLPAFEVCDVNADGRSDLALFNGNVFTVYLQQPDGTFSAYPDWEYPLAIDEEDRDGYRRSHERFGLAPLIADFNRDGFADVLIGDSRRAEAAIFYHQPGAERLYGAPEVMFNHEGWYVTQLVRDLNNDGLMDVVMVRLDKLGIWAILSVLFTHTVDIESLVYLQQPGNEPFREDRDYAMHLSVPFVLSISGTGPRLDSNYIVSIDGDFNGDGRLDLLVKRSETELQLRPGAEEEVFSSDPSLFGAIIIQDTSRFAMSQPYLQDLNADGCSDILLHHRDFQGNVNVIEVKLSRKE